MDKCLYETYFKDYSTSLYDCGNRLKRRHIKSMLPGLAGKKVLDVGAGSGDIRYDLIRNHGASPSDYLSVDISTRTLSLAAKLAEETSTTPFRNKIADAQRLSSELKEKFDVIICSEVLEHLPDDGSAVKSMADLLARDGVILITVPYLGKPVEKWGHFRHYSFESFKSLASEAGLKIDRIRFFGRLHNITWVYMKIFFGGLWWLFRKTTGVMKGTNYMASPLHRRLVMPLVDKLLLLDDLFVSRPRSFIGSQGTVIAALKHAD